MSNSASELLADAHEEQRSQGTEYEMHCDSCEECRVIFVYEGEHLAYEQTVCPDSSCHGKGVE